MAEMTQFEAGIFALTAEGWIIVKRRIFDGQNVALEWVKRNSSALKRRNPSQPVRGNFVPVGTWMTLERVQADYEQKRKDGHPEFNEPAARVFMVGDKITASYTARQGQYLAFIHYYTKLNGQPPSEADMQRHFKLTPPSVHDMILMLERKGMIERTPGMARSIRVLLPREQLPELE